MQVGILQSIENNGFKRQRCFFPLNQALLLKLTNNTVKYILLKTQYILIFKQLKANSNIYTSSIGVELEACTLLSPTEVIGFDKLPLTAT